MEGKREGLLVAQDTAFERLFGELREASSAQSSSPTKLRAAVEVTLAFAAERPQEARLLLVETVGGDRELAMRVLDYHHRLAELMRAECGDRADAPGPPGVTEQALVGAAASLIGTCLATGRVEDLAGLEPELLDFLLLPYSERGPRPGA